jgi:hypothetical protein
MDGGESLVTDVLSKEAGFQLHVVFGVPEPVDVKKVFEPVKHAL